MLTLRPLAAPDAAALVRFYNSLSPATIRTFRPLGDATSLAVCQQLVAENLVAPRQRYDLLGCQDAEIAGWAFLANLHTAGPYLGIVVAEASQGQGLGKALLAQLLDWARLAGTPQLYLMVVQDNQRAINLYEQYGFVTYDQEFDEGDQLPYYHMVVRLGDTA